MISVTVDKNKLSKLIKNLDDFANSLNFERPLKDIAQMVREEQRANFAEQGRLYGGWAPLAESTKRDRVFNGYPASRPILVRTGKLKDGFKVKKVTSKEAVIANDVEYAHYHQDGTTKMPQRKIVDVTSNMKGAISRRIAKHIESNINRYL